MYDQNTKRKIYLSSRNKAIKESLFSPLSSLSSRHRWKATPILTRVLFLCLSKDFLFIAFSCTVTVFLFLPGLPSLTAQAGTVNFACCFSAIVLVFLGSMPLEFPKSNMRAQVGRSCVAKGWLPWLRESDSRLSQSCVSSRMEIMSCV